MSEKLIDTLHMLVKIIINLEQKVAEQERLIATIKFNARSRTDESQQ